MKIYDWELPLSTEIRRAPHNNQYYTKSLFVEESGLDSGAPLSYRAKDHSPRALSLYKLFMEHSDPTEYQFALSVFGDWEHWQTLSNSHFLKPWLNKWRAELEVRTQSILYEQLKEDALSGSKSAASTAKYLLDKFEKTEETKKGRGRPSKRNQDSEKPVFLSSDLKEDLERISGRKVN